MFRSVVGCSRRLKISRPKRRLLCIVSQTVNRVVCQWPAAACCGCIIGAGGDEGAMSSSWRLLEDTPGLVDELASQISDLSEFTLSLEQGGLLSGDSVDHAIVHGPVDTIRSILKRISVKDEASYRRFKRTFIENGEYEAVKLLSDSIKSPDEGDEHIPLSPVQSTSSSLSEIHPKGLNGYLQKEPIFPQPALAQCSRPFKPDKTSHSEEEIERFEEEVDARRGTMEETSASKRLMTVVRTAKELKTGPRIYNMTRNHRGLCVIFNNRLFPNLPEKDRPGSELDVSRMVDFFRVCKFLVFVHEDVSSQMMMSLLDTYANEDVQENHDAFVLILMSHGEINHIYGSDYTTVKLQDIFEKFNNTNCPSLKERPKLFFIQACRGDQPDNGTEARDPFAEIPDDDDDDPIQSDAGFLTSQRAASGSGLLEASGSRLNPRRISCWSDMYIAYAVTEGYESLRDMKSGSWFMKSVYEVMAKYACEEDLDSLMDRVSHKVLEKYRRDGQRQCPEVKKIGWRKKFFFNPGL